MAKKMIDAFREEFFEQVRTSKNYPEAFEKANKRFEERHGFQAFNTYDNFRKRKRK